MRRKKPAGTGDLNSDAATQNATHVTGTNTVTIISGGDTSIVGSTVNAGKFIGDIGGDLNLVSVQDTTNSAAHQSSAGGGFSISTAGGSASVSAARGNADGSYAQVNEQAGIYAGEGGFDIKVRGNTDLKGAVIASEADPSKNSLTTGTLTFSDVENHSEYSASSAGFTAGAGVDSTGKAVGPGAAPGGVIPTFASDSGSESATTRSAIAEGAITITDQANQVQDIATLSRDTAETNGTVSNLPDVQRLLDQQADLMNGVQAAGQVVAQVIGTYATDRQKEAQNQADAAGRTGNPELAAQYQAVADSRDEGGSNRILLHAAGGALLGGLGGGGIGDAVGGAAGAGLSAAMAKQLDSLAKEIGEGTGSNLAGNLAANVAAGVGGALVGGGTGATTAANADLYNRQLHPEERTLAKDIAEKSDGLYTQAQVEDQMRLMGMCVNGGCVSPGVAEELNGRTPTDPGAQWINTGLTNVEGNPLVIQALPEANQALQAYIMASYNSATPGQIPSAFTYSPTPVPTDVLGTVANVAGGVSTAAGRFSAATAAAAQIPSAYSPGLIAASYAGTAAGMVADAVAQIVKPDVGQYAVSGVTGVIVGGLSDRIPGLSPAFNETANVFNSSNAAQKAQDSLNSYWNSFIDYWSLKQ